MSEQKPEVKAPVHSVKKKPAVRKRVPYNVYVTGSHSVTAYDGKLFIDGKQYFECDELPRGVSVDWR